MIKQLTLALTKALDKIGYPYESLVKDQEAHGFTKEKNRYEFYSRLENFLMKHIGN